MKIAICDDCSEDIVHLEKLIRSSKLCPVDVRIFTFPSGDALLKSGIKFDCLFIDLKMKGMNGIETATKIRKLDNNIVLSFYSGYEVGAHKVLGMRPFSYLMKNAGRKVLSDEVDQILAYTLNKYQNNCQIPQLEVQYYSNTTILNLSDILYISINGKGSQIWVAKEKAQELWGDKVRRDESALNSSRTLKEYYQELREYGFAYASTSYIVNIENILRQSKGVITLKGGQLLTITRNTKKSFNEEFVKFWNSKSKERGTHD